MTTMNMAAIMDAIAATCVTQGVSTTPQTYAYPETSFSPPCVIVDYPEHGRVNLDFTFKRGGLEISFPVRVVVGKTAPSIDVRNTLSALLDGAAATMKTALESGGGTLGGVVASTQVSQPIIETLQDSMGAEYLAARFDVQVLV